MTLEDSYVNNDGILHGGPAFADDGGHRCIVFNGRDQYAETPPSVADFGELTIDVLVNRAAGGGGRLFDFGTGDDECFYLAVDGRNGRPTLGARHDGKRYGLTASEGIPAEEWTRVRVEMDGSSAFIHIDGEEVAGKRFEFRPRDVFPGDRPEGNFIACGRNGDEFFHGRMDHFRIYRKVHDDFDTVGPPPFALTQMQEWSEEEQELSDEWEGRRKAKEAELKAGEYGDMQNEIRRLEKHKSALRKTANLDHLEARAREAEKEKRALDRKIHDEFKALPGTVKTEREVKELRRKMDEIMKEIRRNSEYAKLAEDIRTCEKQRGEAEKEIRESPSLKAISAKAGAADEERRKVEERIKQLPELKRIKELSEQEEDNRKKRGLQDKYRRLFEARRLADPGWQKTAVASQRLGRLRDETLRNEREDHSGLAKKTSERHQLGRKLSALETRLRESHPELSRLEKSVRVKQGVLGAKRKQIEERVRSSAAYKNAEAARVAAKKAVEDERKRGQGEKSKELAQIAARISELQKESKLLWGSTLRNAHLLGRNPYPGRDAAKLMGVQQKVVYHTTADWEDRTREEVDGKAPPKMKKWLVRVRGY